MLLSLALFIYFKVTVTITDPDIVPREFEPIKMYVEECVVRAADEAVTIIGQQGGYIDIPLNIDFNPSMYVTPDGLGIVKIPYWFYKGKTYSPNVEFVEREISKYVEENTVECINDFEAFKEQYTITELGEMEVETYLNKDDISLVVEYPIRVGYKSNNTYTKIEKYGAKVDVGLRKIIEAANALLDAELEHVFFENFTIDLMAANPDIPFTDMKFTCKTLQWHITDIKQRVSDMLYYNLPRIRVKNTNYRPFLKAESEYERLLDYHMEDIAERNFPKGAPADSYEYLQMFWDMGVNKEDDLTIGFRFVPEVGLDLIGTPHDNGVLRSKVGEGNKKILNFICMNIYHFLYDVNYPVIITLRDDSSYGGSGYLFNFAIPVTIVNNEPHKGNYGYDRFTTAYVDEGFCDERGDELTDIRAYGNEEGYTNVELNEVNISMQCFKYYCNLGKTAADGGVYRLRTYLPASCSNPFIIAKKDGYLESSKQLDDEGKVELELTRLKKLDYHVVFHRYNSIGDIIDSEKEIEDDMNVSIQLVNDDLQQYKLFPLKKGVGDEVRKIEIIEGDAEYDLDIVLMQGDEYVGGYNGKWHVSGADISNSNVVIFHVLKYVPTPYTREDKLEMMNFILNGNYKTVMKPELE